MKAMLFDVLENQTVRCRLCRHNCFIHPGKRGICRVRENVDGTLETLVYGRLVAANADPIEKKPLFHVAPGSRSFSIAAPGCNFRCAFCQNHQIAQIPDDFRPSPAQGAATPNQVVDQALAAGCKSIAYTYTEPTVFFEFALDTAKLAKQKGLRNVFVTNGYMSAAAADVISPYLDAANVDLKAFTPDFYKTLCKAKLSEVKKSLVHMKKAGIFIEVTTLVIPGENDDPTELKDLAGFIAAELGPETPWHVSRFHPTYRLTNRPSTPEKTLFLAKDAGEKAGLLYVYTGNIHGQGGEDTFCPSCKRLMIRRSGFFVTKNRLENGACPECGARIHGIDM